MTILFTDMEGSTALLQHVGDTAYIEFHTEHHRLLRKAFAEAGGREVDTQGDAFFYVFEQAEHGVAAVIAAQQAIHHHPWPTGAELRVRMGLHTGAVIRGPDGYIGLDVHRGARVMAAAHGGQVLLTEVTAELVKGRLPSGVTLRDLGEHRLKDLTSAEHIFQLVIPDLPSEFPPLKTLGLHHNLPRSLTTFIGREREMAEIKEQLNRTSLLTLTGAGGSGKTRLALEVAAEQLKDFPSGAWFIPLASLTEPGFVPQTVAAALGVREIPGRALVDVLVDYLKPKKLLLVLDNCEHLVASCAQLAEHLLCAAPQLKLIATSREPLGIAGEMTYRVPSLSLPDSKRLPPLDVLAQYEAVRLFVERAASSQPGFVLSDANAHVVARICARLDGIPLAIELAAARTKVLSVEQIAERLVDRFRLLTGGSRTALPRHQTLRATIDWSYELLSERERALLRRAASFAGGFTLEAAEAICAGEGVEGYEILDMLTQLVDKSLVLAETPGGECRYRMLETIRQYASDRLAERKEQDEVRRRHATWYLSLAEHAEPRLRAHDQMLWLERLEREHDNLRAVLDFALAEHLPDIGLQLAGTMARFWHMRGYLSEGRKWLNGVLTNSGGMSDESQAKALSGAGGLAFDQGDYDQAAGLWEKSLLHYQERGDRWGMASALAGLGSVARNRGDYERATKLFAESLGLWREIGDKWGLAGILAQSGVLARQRGDYVQAKELLVESLALWREVGDKWGLTSALANLGVAVGNQGDYKEASGLHEESLALRRELGDRFNVGTSLLNLGIVALNLGEYERARELFEESLSLGRDMGNQASIASSLGNLGLVAYYQEDYAKATDLLKQSLSLWQQLGSKPWIATAFAVLGRVACAQGDHGRALSLFREGLSLYQDHGGKRGIIWTVEGVARASAAQGQWQYAARLFGAAEAIREAVGDPLPPRDRVDYGRVVNLVRANLDSQMFVEAWATGRKLTLQEAVKEALRPNS